MEHRKRDNTILSAVLLSSISILTISFGIELLGIALPCQLCKLQRIPYFATILVSAYGIITKQKRVAIYTIQLAFGISALIAMYHVFVQYGVLSDPCHVPNQIHDIASFKRLIYSQANCAKVTWRLLWLPISLYNAVFSVASIIAIRRFT